MSCNCLPRFEGYALGLIFILLCACLWAGSSVLIQYIYNDLNFDSPFFVTYLMTALLVLHLPLYHVKAFLTQQKYNLIPAPTDQKQEFQYSVLHTDGGVESEVAQRRPEPSSPHRRAFRLALVIAPVWFVANCLYNYSLLLTSVSSSTVISNLSASFTLGFSAAMRLEDATLLKLLGVIVCFTGAISTALQDQQGDDDHDHSVWGDVMALLSAMGYGLYTAMMRRLAGKDEDTDMQLLLGYIGLLNALLLAPVVLVLGLLHLANVAAVTAAAAGFIALNGLCDTVLADYFWARSVLLTSPTVATIGMSITIPIALLTDFLVDGIVPGAIAVIGALLVIAGFVLVNLTEEQVARGTQSVRNALCAAPTVDSIDL